ncbi:hypothetical protein GCM10023221_11630 [Luteimicrobium xylanilyticum]|uniref:Uncharacterized protein n=1 Tax=Luteimicrobium xylanilyticum TaxID=1133546 RepID=A0A5P9QD29_9MICO|nr:hypothetical protein [Luteimicrobium xylanilyticum]QFU99361.1 hypothetical protein KDY119_02891 [Luteimicrobium xylanilyticum]
MTTFDLTVDGSTVVSPGTITTPDSAIERPARPARRARRRWFRAHSLWLQAAVFTVALGAGLFTGYLINR